MSVFYLSLASLYFVLTEPGLSGEENLISTVSSFKWQPLEQLEFLYVPLVTRLVIHGGMTRQIT